MPSFTNTFLIRDPAEALLSLHRMWPDFTLRGGGLRRAGRAVRSGHRGAGAARSRGRRDRLPQRAAGGHGGYCEAVDIPHREDALSWQPGPVEIWRVGRSGIRTPSRAPASPHRTSPRPSCRRASPRWLSFAGRTTSACTPRACSPEPAARRDRSRARLAPLRDRAHNEAVMARAGPPFGAGSWPALPILLLALGGLIAACRAARPDAAGGGARHSGRDRARDQRLRRAQLRQGGGARRRPDRAAHGHARRARRLDAQDHPADPRLAGPGDRFRRPRRRPRGERRHLHPLRLPRRGDGAGDQPRCRDPGPDRRPPRAAAAEPAARGQGGRRGAAGQQAAGGDGGQDPQRFDRLYPLARPAPRTQRRMGGKGGARGREPVGHGGAGAARHRPDRDQSRRSPEKARRPGGRDRRRGAHARRPPGAASSPSSPTGGPSCSPSSPIPRSPTS